MRFSPIAVVAALALACASTSAYADASFQRALTANGNLALDVCTNAGSIHVSGADGNKIQIFGKIHSSNWHILDSTEKIKKIAADPPIQQSGDAVRVGDHETCDGHLLQNITIDYEISIPKNSTIVANTGSGDIRVESISGFLHAETGSGDIRANSIGSDSKLHTGSGSVDVQGAHGTLQAGTGSGSVAIRDSTISDARLMAGSGDITARKIVGGLRANTGSGSLTISGSPTSNWKLETGSGSIHFYADANAKFTVDAGTGSGDIRSKLPITASGRNSNNQLRGSVNGGGPIVRIYTGSGGIDLQ